MGTTLIYKVVEASDSGKSKFLSLSVSVSVSHSFSVVSKPLSLLVSSLSVWISIEGNDVFV